MKPFSKRTQPAPVRPGPPAPDLRPLPETMGEWSGGPPGAVDGVSTETNVSPAERDARAAELSTAQRAGIDVLCQLAERERDAQARASTINELEAALARTEASLAHARRPR